MPVKVICVSMFFNTCLTSAPKYIFSRSVIVIVPGETFFGVYLFSVDINFLNRCGVDIFKSIGNVIPLGDL